MRSRSLFFWRFSSFCNVLSVCEDVGALCEVCDWCDVCCDAGKALISSILNVEAVGDGSTDDDSELGNDDSDDSELIESNSDERGV